LIPIIRRKKKPKNRTLKSSTSLSMSPSLGFFTFYFTVIQNTKITLIKKAKTLEFVA